VILPWWAWCPGLVLTALAVYVVWETARHTARMAAPEAQQWAYLWKEKSNA